MLLYINTDTNLYCVYLVHLSNLKKHVYKFLKVCKVNDFDELDFAHIQNEIKAA